MGTTMGVAWKGASDSRGPVQSVTYMAPAGAVWRVVHRGGRTYAGGALQMAVLLALIAVPVGSRVREGSGQDTCPKRMGNLHLHPAEADHMALGSGRMGIPRWSRRESAPIT